jgi:hypothetical protein
MQPADWFTSLTCLLKRLAHLIIVPSTPQVRQPRASRGRGSASCGSGSDSDCGSDSNSDSNMSTSSAGANNHMNLKVRCAAQEPPGLPELCGPLTPHLLLYP